MIIDASVILKGFFPDSGGKVQAQTLIRDYSLSGVELLAPTLLPYEVANAVVRAAGRGYIEPQMAEEILDIFQELAIPTTGPSLMLVLELARRYERSVCEAAYLALAQEEETQLITGDRQLYDAVGKHLDWVVWIEDYVPEPHRVAA